MDSFVLCNVPEGGGEVNINEEGESHNKPASKDTEDIEGKKLSEKIEDKEDSKPQNREVKKICILYCVFNLSYENHSYIPKGRVIAFAERKNEDENEVFKVEEIRSQEEYRNWGPSKKGVLPVLSKSDFICSPAEVSSHMNGPVT